MEQIMVQILMMIWGLNWCLVVQSLPSLRIHRKPVHASPLLWWPEITKTFDNFSEEKSQHLELKNNSLVTFLPLVGTTSLWYFQKTFWILCVSRKLCYLLVFAPNSRFPRNVTSIFLIIGIIQLKTFPRIISKWPPNSQYFLLSPVHTEDIALLWISRVWRCTEGDLYRNIRGADS